MSGSDADNASIKSAAREWWIRLDSDKASAGDREEFNRWLAADSRHQQAFERLNALWGELDGIEMRVNMPVVEPLAKRRAWRWRWVPPILAAASLAFWLLSPLAVVLRSDFHTGFGEVRNIRLSDGSTVHLNGNSALAVRIDGERRQLTLLQGEAWFEVSPDKSRPFKVFAEQGSITALGTAFNVRLLDSKIEVSVTQHSVAVDLEQQNGPALHAVVEEGKRVIYDAKAGLSPLQTIDTQAVTAWQRGKLVFENRALGEVVAELNRYHRGFLLINDADLAGRRVNGVFRTDQPLAVLDALETSLKLHTTRVGDYLILLHR